MSKPIPLGVLVLVVEDNLDEKTPGGILMPQISKDTQFLTTGVVQDTGPGFWSDGVLIKPEVKTGDRVLFQRTSANQWKDPKTGINYYFLPAGNLLAKFPAE